MDIPPARQAIPVREIHFSQGKRALAVFPPAGTQTIDIIKALGIAQPKAVFMIVGGASELDEHIYPDLTQLITDGIAMVAASNNALVIDGGTQVGVMTLMGQGVVQQTTRSILLGVTPSGNVTYPGKETLRTGTEQVQLDPNHTHFVLVESDEWGGETETMYALARAYSQDCPSLAILVNGGVIAKNEALYNVRQGRSIIIIEGSGRLADEIASAFHKKSSYDSDSILSEVISFGKLHLFPLSGSTIELKQLTQRLLDEQE